MSTENVEIVRGLHEAFREIGMTTVRDALAEGGDLPATAAAVGRLGEIVLDSVDPDVEIELVASSFSLPDMPAGTHLHGLEGWGTFWRGWLEPWEAAPPPKSTSLRSGPFATERSCG